MDKKQVRTEWHLTNGESITARLNADDFERFMKYAGEGSAIQLDEHEHESVYINWSNVACVEVEDL